MNHDASPSIIEQVERQLHRKTPPQSHAYNELRRIEARQASKHGRLTERHLNRQIADKLPNCADSLPFPLPTEPDHIGATVKEPAPKRGDMWWLEREHPMVGWLYVLAFVAVIVGSWMHSS
jgi:hypothetical protein